MIKGSRYNLTIRKYKGLIYLFTLFISRHTLEDIFIFYFLCDIFIILDNFIKGLKLKKNKENNYITFSYLIQSIN